MFRINVTSTSNAYGVVKHQLSLSLSLSLIRAYGLAFLHNDTSHDSILKINSHLRLALALSPCL